MTKRRGAVVERLVNMRTRRTAEIRLDKSTMTFWCELDGATFENKDGHSLRFEIEAQLKRAAATDADWLPVLHVEFDTGRRYGYSTDDGALYAGLSVIADRFYYAAVRPLVKKGALESVELLQLPWTSMHGPHKITEDQRMDQARPWRLERWGGERTHRFRLPYHVGDREFYLAYTDDLWNNLADIIQTIDTAHRAMHTLLTTDEGMARLTAPGGGVLMLGGGRGSR